RARGECRRPAGPARNPGILSRHRQRRGAAQLSRDRPRPPRVTAAGAMTELVVEHLSLRFGGLAVLDDVSLQVARGQLLALIGPNGGGKTSVFNCISGIYRGEGTIRLNGVEISGKPSYQIAQLGVARTFQHGEVFPHMTVTENLLTGRHARIPTNMLAEMFFLPGVRRQELEHREAIEKIMSFFG